MLIGAAWYPEYHPEAQWDRDLSLMAAAGITTVRFAEFAWSQMEPEPGRFDTDWMARALDAFQRHRIQAVIGTPTATPPAWLAESDPTTLPVDDTGRRTGFGTRQHRCYNAPAYRERTRLIVEHLARRFGRHPALVAWQIDNEIGGELKACYCDICGAAFQRWLSGRYADITDLNRRWGTQFWSQTYLRFDQIPIPRKTAMQLMVKHNPSLMLEWMRFQSQVMVGYCHEQAAALRASTPAAIPILTNYDAFEWGENIDLRHMFSGLDLAGLDLYSQKDHEIAFYCDFMHDVKQQPFWFMEYGTGSPKLATELDAIAGSGHVDRLLFFKFRPFPWGQEQGTRELLTIMGTPGPNYHAIKEWTARHAAPSTHHIAAGTETSRPARRRVGVVYDFDSSWSRFLTGWSGVPQDLTYPRGLIDPVYKSLHDQGERARFVLRPEDLRDIELLLLPWTVIHDPALEDAVARHVAGGGSLLMTQDVFLKNRDNVFNETLPRLYRELLGCGADFLDHEPAGAHALVRETRAGAARIVVLGVKADLGDWTHWVRELLRKRV